MIILTMRWQIKKQIEKINHHLFTHAGALDANNPSYPPHLYPAPPSPCEFFMRAPCTCFHFLCVRIRHMCMSSGHYSFSDCLFCLQLEINISQMLAVLKEWLIYSLSSPCTLAAPPGALTPTYPPPPNPAPSSPCEFFMRTLCPCFQNLCVRIQNIWVLSGHHSYSNCFGVHAISLMSTTVRYPVSLPKCLSLPCTHQVPSVAPTPPYPFPPNPAPPSPCEFFMRAP